MAELQTSPVRSRPRAETKGTVEVPVKISDDGSVAQSGQPGLRQRLKVKMDDVSKGVEEMSVKLKRKVCLCLRRREASRSWLTVG